MTRRVHLSTRELRLSAAELVRAAKRSGYIISRATAARAKKNGRFAPRYRHAARDRQLWRHVLGWVILTQSERRRPARWIADEFGVGYETGKRAKERGWFEVNDSNYRTVDVHLHRLTRKPPG